MHRSDIAIGYGAVIGIEGARTVLMVSLSSMPKRFEGGVSNDINRREAGSDSRTWQRNGNQSARPTPPKSLIFGRSSMAERQLPNLMSPIFTTLRAIPQPIN